MVPMSVKEIGPSGLRDGDSGQAMVELAFALPILLVILFGIVEFANAWRTSELVTNAAREGARRAVAAGGPKTEAGIKSEVNEVLNRVGLDSDKAEITLSCENPPGGSVCGTTAGVEQTVQIDYAYDWIVLGPVIKLIGGSSDPYTGSATITGTSAMRNEG